MIPLFRYLHRLLLGVWIGALLCFGAVIAPSLFQALTPAQAGSVVHLVFPKLDAFTVFAGFALLAMGIAVEGRPAGRGRIRAGLVVAMTLLACTSAFAVTPRMAALRAQANPSMSDLPKEHPVRREFGRLHGVSSMLLLGEVLLGLGALAFPLRRRGEAEAVGEGASREVGVRA
jgi:hypothetical protein